jgi:hypothetical protein
MPLLFPMVMVMALSSPDSRPPPLDHPPPQPQLSSVTDPYVRPLECLDSATAKIICDIN